MLEIRNLNTNIAPLGAWPGRRARWPTRLGLKLRFCLSCGRLRRGRAWRCLPGGPGDKWSIAGAAGNGAEVGLRGPGLVLSSAPRTLLRRGEERDCGRSWQLCTAGSESVSESRTGGRLGRGSRSFGARAAGRPLGFCGPALEKAFLFGPWALWLHRLPAWEDGA
ncbi:hypothetical protein NDU88_004750 [Pleurodeles waltl]|uniref:Uncharacterized protein n=1 Tax=Pleurodeles waltl TaxID=8319 RepID=A0AAV7LRY5_PLEWA|nr:hypothetical protein NDU88_004750 [Pleurodeles waltl]